MQNDNVNPTQPESQQPPAGAQVQNQVQDLGKQASQQISNLGQTGVNQLGGAMGKILNPTDQKVNQPPVKQDEKIYATIAYIPFVAILSIIIKPDSAFVRLHSKQGLLLSILFFFVGILAAIVALFGIIGQVMAFVLGLVPLACLIIGVYSMYLTFNGYWWKIPVLSALADLIPIELIAKTSKENLTGQVGIAKTDYDNRQETLKSAKTDATAASASVSTAATTTPAASLPTTEVPKNVTPGPVENMPSAEQKTDVNSGDATPPKSN